MIKYRNIGNGLIYFTQDNVVLCYNLKSPNDISYSAVSIGHFNKVKDDPKIFEIIKYKVNRVKFDESDRKPDWK
jgi:hypothetical protein